MIMSKADTLILSWIVITGFILGFLTSGPEADEASVARTTNDTETDNEFPSLVAITEGHSMRLICAGTLIGDSVVLTAAHCFNEYTKFTEKYFKRRILRVVVGLQRDTTFFQATKDVPVSKVILHDKFDASNSFYPNDVALVFLKTSISESAYVRFAALSSQNETFPPPYIAKFPGWIPAVSSDRLTRTLVRGSIKVISNDKCATSLDEPLLLGPGYLCASQLKGPVCSGGSGGPVFKEITEVSGGAKAVRTRRLVQIGMVNYRPSLSVRPPKCSEGKPIVFLAVNHYRDWIEASKALHASTARLIGHSHWPIAFATIIATTLLAFQW